MTAALVVIALLVLLLAYAGFRIEGYQRALFDAEIQPQLLDNSALISALWNRVRAQVLRDAAEDWPKVDAVAERKRLSWVPTASGDPESLVVRWMLARAEQIEQGESVDHV
jgi:hypothetical protein